MERGSKNTMEMEGFLAVVVAVRDAAGDRPSCRPQPRGHSVLGGVTDRL